MFEFLFTCVISICHGYVFWRAASISFFQIPRPRRNLIIIALALWLLFVGSFIFGRTVDTPWSRWLLMGGMTWMGTLFLLTCSLLAVEFVTIGGCFLPNLAKTLRSLAMALALLLAVIALHQGTTAPEVDRFEVTLPELPAKLDGEVVVVMSDLHIGTMLSEERLATIISEVREQHPQLILLVGDIFEGFREQPNPIAINLLRTMTAPMGVWGVPGNHEFYGRSLTIKALEQSGVKLLRNSWAEVSPGLILAGVEEHTISRRPEEDTGLITQALAGRPPGATILLSHKPWGAEEAAAARVDLMLSGHTHGGQIWPFNYLVARLFPLLEGRYMVNNMPVLVCRGTGTWGAPMRLWKPGEIMRITLRSGQHA